MNRGFEDSQRNIDLREFGAARPQATQDLVERNEHGEADARLKGWDRRA